MTRNEGHRRLLALSLSSAEVAARLGVAVELVSALRRGQRTPDDALRLALERVCCIPARSWDWPVSR